VETGVRGHTSSIIQQRASVWERFDWSIWCWRYERSRRVASRKVNERCGACAHAPSTKIIMSHRKNWWMMMMMMMRGYNNIQNKTATRR